MHTAMKAEVIFCLSRPVDRPSVVSVSSPPPSNTISCGSSGQALAEVTLSTLESLTGESWSEAELTGEALTRFLHLDIARRSHRLAAAAQNRVCQDTVHKSSLKFPPRPLFPLTSAGLQHLGQPKGSNS
ncbi:unnamed protein product [Pleuronectes platessa]|uniref:Uncharacterized protein n=1 Tax=Pleuronectes platessa TaxID=8262 RepID=A0A9N7VJP1_PLEPL|nr:unnamed protein product [Pleuronectes platessa]